MLQQSTYKLQCLFKLLKSPTQQNVADTASTRQVSFADHRSQVIVLPIHKVSQTLVKANLRPNFLGLRLAFTSVWDTFCIGKTMTCDL